MSCDTPCLSSQCRACGALVCWDCLVRVKMGDGAVAVSRICGDCEKKPAAKLILAAFEQQVRQVGGWMRWVVPLT